MKTRAILLGLLLSIGFYPLINAQITYGVKGGINVTDVAINGIMDGLTPKPTMEAGFTFGAFSEIALNEHFAFQPGFNYSERGFSVKEGFDITLFNIDIPLGVQAVTKLKYLEMPLLAKYTFGNQAVRGYVNAGPVLSYAIDGDLETRANFILDFNLTSHDINLNNNLYNRWEVGGMTKAGVEFDTGNGSIMLETGYYHAFTDMLDDPIVNIKMKNRGLNFNVGYKLMF